MSSVSPDINILTQNMLDHDILDVNITLKRYKQAEEKCQSIDDVNKLKTVLIDNIQKKIAEYLQNIEENLSEYWAVNKADKINRFLDEINEHWERFSVLFQSKDDSILSWLTINIKDTLEQLESNYSSNEIDKQLDELEKAIFGASHWSSDMEEKILHSLVMIKLQSIKHEKLKRIFSLFTSYRSNNTLRITDKLPELYIHQNGFIDFSQDGNYNLYTLTDKGWIPAYSWQNDKIYPDVTFHQTGEWKHRKFKCESWQIRGTLPVGSIFKMSYKKTTEYFISTVESSNTLALRNIDLETFEIKKIRDILKNRQQRNVDSSIDQFPINKTIFFFRDLFDSAISIKIGLSIYSKDKSRATFISKLFTFVIEKIANQQQNKEVLNNLMDMLDPVKDKKYITFIKKQL